MTDEKSCQISLVARCDSNIVVVACCKQQFVNIRRGVFFECKPNCAENHVGDLVLPECELHFIPRVAAGGSELKQLDCFVLLLCEHCLLLFR